MGNVYPARDLLEIAKSLLRGEMAYRAGDAANAVLAFEEAVTLQDALPYTEPPFWYYPTRQSLGAALLASDRVDEAQAVFEADLEQYPMNGWSMFGLAEALRRQGDEAGAEQITRALRLFGSLRMSRWRPRYCSPRPTKHPSDSRRPRQKGS